MSSEAGPEEGDAAWDRWVSGMDGWIAAGGTYWARPDTATACLLLSALLFFPALFIFIGLITGNPGEVVGAAIFALVPIAGLWYLRLYGRRAGFYLDQQELGYADRRGNAVFRIGREEIGRIDVNSGGGYVRVQDRTGRVVLDRMLDQGPLGRLSLMARIVERSQSTAAGPEPPISRPPMVRESEIAELTAETRWDGIKWWWNGAEWVPASQAPMPPPTHGGRSWSDDGSQWFNGSHWVPVSQAPIPAPPRSFLDRHVFSSGCTPTSAVVLIMVISALVLLHHFVTNVG